MGVVIPLFLFSLEVVERAAFNIAAGFQVQEVAPPEPVRILKLEKVAVPAMAIRSGFNPVLDLLWEIHHSHRIPRSQVGLDGGNDFLDRLFRCAAVEGDEGGGQAHLVGSFVP